MNMISRQEYLNALEVIDKYHLQQVADDHESSDLRVKTPIRVWLAEQDINNPIVRRLWNLLSEQNLERAKIRLGFYLRYIEDISVYHLLHMHGFGKRTISVFQELRGY